MRDSDFIPERSLLAGVLVAFLVVVVLAAMDIFSDLKEGTTFSHILSEASGKAGSIQSSSDGMNSGGRENGSA